MEFLIAVRLVLAAFCALLPFFSLLFALAACVVALTVLLYRVGIKKNSAPV